MKPRGFSLYETVVATLLISVVLIILFSLFVNARLSGSRVEQGIQADALAQTLLEQHRATPFEQLTLGTTQPSLLQRGGIDYQPTVEVFLPEPPSDGLKGIRVTIDWHFRNRDYQVVHESWVAHLEH